MFKQSVSRIKKVLPVLLAVLFVVSLTAAAASAHFGYGWGHHYGVGFSYPYGYYPMTALGVASPIAVAETTVPTVTTSAVAAAPVVASPVVASSVVVADPGIVTAPFVTGFGYGFGGYPYWGGFGGWRHGVCHHR